MTNREQIDFIVLSLDVSDLQRVRTSVLIRRAYACSGDERKLHHDVWAVLVLADGTMVSGDSGGNVQVWDASHGTLITGFRQHKADVLALAASPEGDTLFASGADPQIAVFRRIPAARGEPFLMSDGQCLPILPA